MTIGHFLGGIAALIWDAAQDRYLLLRRSASKDFLSGDWECVTGRVEQGESFVQALKREVWEEIGIDQVQIEFLIGVTHFYRGAERSENELLGAIFGCTIQAVEQVRIEDEHSELRWVTAQKALEMLPADHWLEWVIRRAEALRRNTPLELHDLFLQEGFER
jgi:8-oxo-dGTP diphosphatase